jgi:hypothetical protein
MSKQASATPPRTRRRSQRRLHERVWVQIGRHKVAGTITAIDLPGLPYGIQVQFRDGPLRPGEPDNCYATYDEVKPRP